MLFSGYQLAIHLLNSTFEDDAFNREDAIKKAEAIRVQEDHLQGNGTHRNSTFVATGPFKSYRDTYFIKQPRFADASLISSVLNEYYILGLFKAADLKPLDTLIGYDAYQHLLFQRFIEGKTFDTNVKPSETYLQTLAQELGIWFAEAHSITRTLIDKSAPIPNKFAYRKPLFWAVSLRDLEELRDGLVSPEQLEIIDILTNSADPKIKRIETNYRLLHFIQEIVWHQKNLIHFDFKLEHLRLAPGGIINGLVDWEMADLGDIHWDIASIWLELMRPFMFEGKSVSDIMTIGITYLAYFFKKYRTREPILPERLLQFLGVLILQKHYYRQFSMGMDAASVKAWLREAEALIRNPDPNKYPLTPPAPSQSFSSVSLTPPPDDTKHKGDEDSTTGTMQDLHDLAHILLTDYTTNNKLNLTLEQYIYRWFNGNLGWPVDTSDRAEVAKPPRLGAETYLEDRWWRVEGLSKNNSVNIRKGSIRRVVEPGAFVYQRHDARNFLRSGVWSYVKVLYPNYVIRPNDVREDRNDLWVHSQLRIPQDFANWVRFYVNLKGNLDGVHLFIDTLSDALNERQIPFEIKIRNSLSSFTRSDSAIVFIHRNHSRAAIDAITFTYKQLRPNGSDSYLDDTAIPRFSKGIKGFGGISYAENPPVPTLSFGMWRSKLIAGYIGDLLTAPQFTGKVPADQHRELVKKMMDGFKNDGFNVYELYRNPYPKKHKFAFRFDLLRTGLDRPAMHTIDLDGSVAFRPRQTFLKAACEVGFMLCREAVWYGSYCTWFCFKRDDDDRAYFETINALDRLGIALFLCQLALHCPDVQLFQDCLHGIRRDPTSGRPDPETLTLEEHLATIETELGEHRPPIRTVNKTFDYLLLRQILYSDDTTRNPWRVAPLAEVLRVKYIDQKLPFPNAYVTTNLDPVSTEFNPTLTNGLAALGYLFLLVVDNPDRPIKNLSAYYDIQRFRDDLNQLSPFLRRFGSYAL